MNHWGAPGCLAALSAAFLASQSAAAQEDGDLARIPAVVVAPPAPGATVATPRAVVGNLRMYLDTALTESQGRGDLAVPLGGSGEDSWNARSSFDIVYTRPLPSGLSLDFSGRLNMQGAGANNSKPKWVGSVDYREGYVGWASLSQTYIDIGRINVRNGTALGDNPTDFFKTGTLISQTSADPSQIRNDRLGTFMARIQHLWSWGSVGLVLAPKLQDPKPLPLSLNSGIDPLADRTNGTSRLLLSLAYNFAGLSPQLLLYHEDNETRYGVDVSHTVGDSIIAYAEWAGGRQVSLIERARSYGIRTGTLPSGTPLLPDGAAGKPFSNDFAVGASWVGAHKLTVNVEYHYHGSGLSQRQSDRALDAGAAAPGSIGQLVYYTRAFANFEQEPETRHQFFIRADCVDAFIPNLELSAFTFVNVYDGSTFSQLSASYYASNHWTIAAYFGGTIGSRRSQYGSLPSRSSVSLQAVRYF